MKQLFLAFLILITGLGGSAMGQCVISNTTSDESMDAMFTPQWCTTWEHIRNLYKGLHLYEEKEFWDSQIALDGGYCNDYAVTPRLFNAAWYLNLISGWRNNITLEQNTYDFYSYVAERSPDGYIATCENGHVATNYYNWGNVFGPSYTALRPGFFQRGVPLRASTLVHEATHENSHHWDASGFGWCDDSMDPWYGPGNAQTWQISFLLFAFDTYQKDPETHELYVKPLTQDPNRCGFIPAMNQHSFDEAVREVNLKIADCFIISPAHRERDHYFDILYPGLDIPTILAGYPPYLFDPTFERHQWPCEYCVPGDVYKVCNEEWQPGNAAVNAFNLQRCTEINGLIQSGTATQSEIASEWTSFLNFSSDFAKMKRECIPGVSPEYREHYCSEKIRNWGEYPDVNSLVDAFDDLEERAGGWIPDDVVAECIGRFCHERFDPSWQALARDACYEWTDPAGCMEESCGKLSDYPPTSLEYFQAVQCRRQYIENTGEPNAYFTASDAIGVCSREYLLCKDKVAYPLWLADKEKNQCYFTQSAPASAAASIVNPLYNIKLDFMHQIRALRFLKSINYNVTYDQFKNVWCPSCEIDKCEVWFQVCEKAAEKAAEIAANFVVISEIPHKMIVDLGLPRPPEYLGQMNPIVNSMRTLANILVDNSVLKGQLYNEALRQLINVPENLYAVKYVLGPSAFAALYGTKGMDRIFGDVYLTPITPGPITFNFLLNPEQEQLVPAMTALKDLRVRIESPETLNLFDMLGTANPEALYNFMGDLYRAETVDQINILLDMASQWMPPEP
jgi:hypothetical protein